MILRHHGGQRKFFWDFSVNLNPLVNEKKLKKMLAEAASYAICYPEERAESLIAELSALNGINSNNIVAGNGSMELFYHLPLLLKPVRAFILEPTFCEYSYICEINSIPVTRILPEEEFCWNFKALREKLAKGDMVFVCNPNNPTGNVIKKEDIISLTESGAYVIVDEAFMDFSHENQSLIGAAAEIKNLIVVKSLTKIFSIAGLRVGYMVADRKIINKVKMRLPLWNVNGVAIELTKRLLKTGIIGKTVGFVKGEREWMMKGFSQFAGEIRSYPSFANFLLCQSKKATELIEFAANKGFALRSNKGFYGLSDNYFRIAVKTRQENRSLLEMFKEFFRK